MDVAGRECAGFPSRCDFFLLWWRLSFWFIFLWFDQGPVEKSGCYIPMFWQAGDALNDVMRGDSGEAAFSRSAPLARARRASSNRLITSTDLQPLNLHQN